MLSMNRSAKFSTSTAEIKHCIATTDLYRQSCGGCPTLICLPFDGVVASFEPSMLFATFQQEVVDIYISKQAMITRAERVLEQEQQGIPKIHQEYTQWCQERDNHLQYTTLIAKKNLRQCTIHEVLTELIKYNAIVFSMWHYSFIIDCFDPSGADIVEESVWKYYPSISADKHELLLRHTQPTTAELLERRAIVALLQHEDNAAQVLKNEFHWIENNYSGVRDLPTTYFQKVLNKQTAQYTTSASLTQRVDEIDKMPRRIKKEKEKIMAQWNIRSEHQRIISLFAFLTDWREERKRNTQMMSWGFQQFINALAHHWGLEPQLVTQIHSEEYDLFGSSIEHIQNTLNRRYSTGMVYAMDNRNGQRFIIDEPNDVQSILNKVNEKMLGEAQSEVRGMIARRGIVEGTVRIINTTNDFPKFHDGDILISGMTRPELMQVIRKAGGIITDEGGITCHAAVISRELGIPCIIGTQTATRTFKDGDQILLDADTGVVRKIAA